MTLDAALNGISTDVQNVPIDRVSDTHKLLILPMSHCDWCSYSVYNHFSAAPFYVIKKLYLLVKFLIILKLVHLYVHFFVIHQSKIYCH